VWQRLRAHHVRIHHLVSESTGLGQRHGPNEQQAIEGLHETQVESYPKKYGLSEGGHALFNPVMQEHAGAIDTHWDVNLATRNLT